MTLSRLRGPENFVMVGRSRVNTPGGERTSNPSIVDSACAMQASACLVSWSAEATRALASHASACHVRSAVDSVA
jgi:hypothetical protein